MEGVPGPNKDAPSRQRPSQGPSPPIRSGRFQRNRFSRRVAARVPIPPPTPADRGVSQPPLSSSPVGVVQEHSSSRTPPRTHTSHRRSENSRENRAGSPGGSDSRSVLSDYDMLNDTIQEYLLASDDSDDDDFAEHLGSATVVLYASALLPAGGAGNRRRRLARKAESSTSLPLLASRGRGLARNASAGTLVSMEDDLPVALAAERRRRNNKKKKKAKKKRRAQLLEGIGERSSASLIPPLMATYRGVPVGALSVVLDLDETLVYARDGAVHVRPFVGSFLNACEELRCEVIVWTAGVPDYVSSILHAIGDACGREVWFHHILSRHRRWFTEGCTSERVGVKDLQLLGRPLRRVLVFENNPVSVCLQPSNAILVPDYLAQDGDDDIFRVLTGVLRRVVERMSSPETSSPVLAAGGTVDGGSVSAATREGAVPPSVPRILSTESVLRRAKFDLRAYDEAVTAAANEEEEEQASSGSGEGADSRNHPAAAGTLYYGPILPTEATPGIVHSGFHARSVGVGGPSLDRPLGRPRGPSTSRPRRRKPLVARCRVVVPERGGQSATESRYGGLSPSFD